MAKNTAGQTNTQPQAKETNANVKTNQANTEKKGATDSKTNGAKK